MDNLRYAEAYLVIREFEADIKNLIENHADKEIAFRPREPGDARNHSIKIKKNKIEGMYFTDIPDVLADNSSRLGLSADEVAEVTNFIQLSKRIRNDIAHAKEIDQGKLKDLQKRARDLTFDVESIHWVRLDKLVASKFKLIFEGDIPKDWVQERYEVKNNLPHPDYSETGFIGRADDIERLIDKLENSPFPISISGEGGIGKTAFLNEVLSRVRNTSSDFDGIIWVSLKNNYLDVTGVQEIPHAPVGFRGLLAELDAQLVQLGLKADEETIGTSLAQHRLIVALDNLEVADASEIKQFLRDSTGKSKIVMATRRGLGELEDRFALDPLNDADLVSYFKSLQGVYRTEISTDDAEILAICTRFYKNTLLIKMLVRSAAQGRTFDPQTRLDTYGDAIDFCVGNVFASLDEAEKFVVMALKEANRPLSFSEILYVAFMAKEDVDQVADAINRITSTSLVRAESFIEEGAVKHTYVLTDIARGYLNIDAKRGITEEGSRAVNTLLALDNEKFNRPVYVRSTLRPRTRTEYIAAHVLDEAYAMAFKRDDPGYEKALDFASNIAPAYSDVERARSYILSRKEKNPHGALKSQLQAEALDPANASHKKFTAIVMMDLQDFGAAVNKIKEALALDPQSPDLRMTHADILKREGQYAEALNIYTSIVASDLPGEYKYINRMLYKNYSDCLQRMAFSSSRARQHQEALEWSGAALSVLEQAHANQVYFDPGRVLENIVRTLQITHGKVQDHQVVDTLLDRAAHLEQVFEQQMRRG